MRDFLRRLWPPSIAFILVFLLFEFLNRWGWVSPQLLPAPSSLISVFLESSSEFYQAFLHTTSCVLLGWAASSVLGITLALALSLSETLRRAVLPFAIFFQTVPIIAIAPLLVIYFGFGAPTVIASSMIVAIFPIIANTLIGLESVSTTKIDLFRIYHANRWQILWKLRWPSAYDSLYIGLKVACGLAVIGAIAGEFVAGGGLGALIDSARTQQRIDMVFVCLFLLSAMGLLLVGALQLMNYFVKKVFHYGLNLKD